MSDQQSISRIRNMLNVIDPNNSQETIKSALQILADRIDDNDEDGQKALAELQSVAERDNEFENNIANLVQSYEIYLDKKLPDFLRQIESKVNDYSSASKAISQFNISFFANIPMSLNAKQQIAAVLMKQVKIYTDTDGNNFWKTLVDGNSDMLLQVLFTANPNSILDFESN